MSITLKDMARVIAEDQIASLDYLTVLEASDEYNWGLSNAEAEEVHRLALNAKVAV